MRNTSRFLSATLTQEIAMNANANNSEDLRAFVQTSEQAGEYVWVITLVDFGAKKVKRSLVSDDRFAMRAAAQDAGEAYLKGLAADR
jgi:hypothetical protein